MPGTYTIRTDPSVPPVQHARWKVPIEYRDQIEQALDDMVLKGVIAPVTKPTAWVSSLTYPCKPDGSLHICLNPKDLNKAIVWEHYKAPTLDEITHHLSGATCFSKLDAKDGFWSIHLDEDSSYLTTFNTHCGRYRFLHMPFGLKISQDIFQMWMDQATDCLPSIIAIHDDICMFGLYSWGAWWAPLALNGVYQDPWYCIQWHKVSHQAASDCLLWCSFHWPGHATRPHQNPSLTRPSCPNLQTKLQSFLGLINYLQPFIPGLSAKTTFLWEQLSQWDWNPSTDAAFQHLKAWICQTFLKVTLAYYDRTKPAMIQTDASEFGLGTASGWPIAFPVKLLLTFTTWTLRESVFQYALVWRNSTPISMGGMFSLRMTTSHWKWSSTSLSMQLPLGFSRCFCVCRSMTIPLSINLVKTWSWQTT